MNFKFDPEKTVQAAALFLKMQQSSGPMNYMALIKLLYMADRLALDQLARPITGDTYRSMKLGPVLSEVLELINEGPDYNQGNPWFKYISAPSNYCVELIADPGTGELCEAEEEIIRKIDKDYGHLGVFSSAGHSGAFKLSELTHQMFSEWQKPSPGSAIPIQMEEILRALGKSDKEVEDVRLHLEQENDLDLLLNNFN